MAGGPWLLVALVVLWGDRGMGRCMPNPQAMALCQHIGGPGHPAVSQWRPCWPGVPPAARLFPAPSPPPGASAGRAGLPGEGGSSARACAGSSSLTIVGAHQCLVLRAGGGGGPAGFLVEGAGVCGTTHGEHPGSGPTDHHGRLNVKVKPLGRCWGWSPPRGCGDGAAHWAPFLADRRAGPLPSLT